LTLFLPFADGPGDDMPGIVDDDADPACRGAGLAYDRANAVRSDGDRPDTGPIGPMPPTAGWRVLIVRSKLSRSAVGPSVRPAGRSRLSTWSPDGVASSTVNQSGCNGLIRSTSSRNVGMSSLRSAAELASA
jgi:hypothetical protein